MARGGDVRYDPSPAKYDDHFIHLTNYSINKYSDKFVANTDAERDDVGACAVTANRLAHTASCGWFTSTGCVCVCMAACCVAAWCVAACMAACMALCDGGRAQVELACTVEATA